MLMSGASCAARPLRHYRRHSVKMLVLVENLEIQVGAHRGPHHSHRQRYLAHPRSHHGHPSLILSCFIPRRKLRGQLAQAAVIKLLRIIWRGLADRGNFPKGSGN